MSSDRTLLHDRLFPRPGVTTADDDAEAGEDCGAFGLLRGARERAVMLELRLLGGNREAFPYALLERASFDPSAGLALRFVGAVVTLAGRNLDRPTPAGVSLLDAVLRQRAAWVAERDELHSAALSADAAVVTRIDVRSV